MDFKVRVLDFIAIYVKKNGYSRDPMVQIKLIRGLLKGLSTAHTDENKPLFDRIKSVLAMMAKQQAGGSTGSPVKAAAGESESG